MSRIGDQQAPDPAQWFLPVQQMNPLKIFAWSRASADF
jgi:hypothetical protein